MKLQKNIRIITCLKYTPDKNNVYSTTGILPFNDLVKYKIGLLMYKISSGNVPIYLQQLFKSNKEVHTHYTRQAQHLHSMKGKSEFVYRTFVFQSVVIWNQIIENINIKVSLVCFKHSLKDFLVFSYITFRYDR